MIEKEINKIDIIPAVFSRYREDGNVVLRCLQGDETVDRAFEATLFKEISNLNYILIGIITGVQYMQLTVCDGTDFKNLYSKKWSVLYENVEY